MEKQWISVEERLPEGSLNSSVLGWDTVNIIAWMPAPVPSPYQP